ncbi:KGK domain-containing protein [Nostoc sp. NMS8]|uniref:KGK domain-containing protein n=1 Tax=Nostoc sp. NMS8 TaxID=2815392 RepID=UPI0025E313AD|nr:KGK domain-containing protein [Nostoc sp. NMS8]MBN3958954.1 KGK family protein [Nostoc sp. NMS8]
MKNKFITLDCDDVVLLEKDTFKVSRLKELVQEQIYSKWERHSASYLYSLQNANTQISEFFKQLSVSQEIIKIDEVKLNLVIDCQILKISSRGWQKGKLKIKIYISNATIDKYRLYLEFYPDESAKPESSLDDIRKMIEAT